MTATRLLRLSLLASLVLGGLAIRQWRDPEADPIAPWLGISLTMAIAATVIVMLVGKETRPRAMFRFLASLSAIIAAITLVSDLTSSSSAPTTTLLNALNSAMPSLMASIKTAISTGISPTLWSPILTGLLDQPTWLVFGCLALGLGYAGRPMRRVNIFVN